MATSPSSDAPRAPANTGDTALDGAISPPDVASPNQSETSSEVPPQLENAPEQASGDQKEGKQCAFLGIPAELRNRIYRAALVPGEDSFGDTINISPSLPGALRNLPPEPPLLRACKQIREEATSIYEQENQFWIQLVEFDIRNTQRWLNTFRNPKKMSITVSPGDAPLRWSGALHWLQATHEKDFPGPRGPSREVLDPDQANAAILSFFDVAKRLKSQGRSWSEIKPTLEDMCKALATVSDDWAVLVTENHI